MTKPDNFAELISNLKDGARYLLQNGQTKQGLAVQACVTMLEDDSDDADSVPVVQAPSKSPLQLASECGGLPLLDQKTVAMDEGDLRRFALAAAGVPPSPDQTKT